MVRFTPKRLLGLSALVVVGSIIIKEIFKKKKIPAPIKVITDVVDKVVEPIADIIKPVTKVAKKTVKKTTKTAKKVTEPVTKAAKEIVKPVEKVVKKVAKRFEKGSQEAKDFMASIRPKRKKKDA